MRRTAHIGSSTVWRVAASASHAATSVNSPVPQKENGRNGGSVNSCQRIATMSSIPFDSPWGESGKRKAGQPGLFSGLFPTLAGSDAMKIRTEADTQR